MRPAIALLFALLGLAVLTGADSCSGEQNAGGIKTVTVAGGATTTDTDETTTESVTANPDAKYGSNCDMLLGAYSGSGFDAHVVADARVHNTGNIGIVAEVKAHWDRAGTSPLKMSKTIRLPVDAKQAVHFRQAIDQATIEAVQSADYRCDVKVVMVDTFGEAQ